MARPTRTKRLGQCIGFRGNELLVVVVIIGILAAIGTENYLAAMDRARVTGMMSECRAVQIGMETWKTDFSILQAELLGTSPDQALASIDAAHVAAWSTDY